MILRVYAYLRLNNTLLDKEYKRDSYNMKWVWLLGKGVENDGFGNGYAGTGGAR